MRCHILAVLPVELFGDGELVEVVGGSGARQDATALAPQHVIRLLARRALVHIEHARNHKSQLVKLRAYESPQTQHSRLPCLTDLRRTNVNHYYWEHFSKFI